MPSNRAPAYIQTEGATFRGPDGPVFKNCTLTIEPSQRWALLGPNGGGKGLLLAALMGKLGLLEGRLRHPFLEGDARFVDSVFGVLPPGSIALASMKEHRQWLLSRDFHQLRWHGSLTAGTASVSDLLDRRQVEQWNAFAVLDPSGDLRYAKAKEREIERFALGSLLDRPVAALSNGELHRFVLARSLLRQPRLLMIDDPTAGLDARSRIRLYEILEEIEREGIGVIVATEREDDLPRGITHLLRVQSRQILDAGPRRGTHAPKPAAETAPTFAFPRVESRPVPGGIPILEMRAVRVRQGTVRLLDDITFSVAQGEHWALLGPNGSGKSTLLSLVMADNPQAHANDVRIAGHRLGPGRSIWDQKAHLGWLSPELEAHYPPGARTREVVLSGFASSLGLHVSLTHDQTSAASAWLDRLGLRSLAETPFGDLLPVARRLALLARAVVHQPSLLLFDEPCQGLDPAGRTTLSAALSAAVLSLSAAMIYVTHEADEIPPSVQSLLVLEAGRVQYVGPRAAYPRGSHQG